MDIARTQKYKALWPGSILVLLLAALLFNGCSGIEPYDPPDYREEPPVQGLLTGEEGEFVIYRKADEPETGSESGKRLGETVDDEQP